jgi:hypothetical protein
MNILHLNQSDLAGGAAIAGYRLHQGLLAQGVDSRLLVGKVKTSSDRVAAVPRKLRLENQLSRITRQQGLNYLNHLSSFDIPQHHLYQEADLLNFHNLHNGYFNYLAIPLSQTLKLRFGGFPICGVSLDTVPTATTAPAGKLAVANVLIPIPTQRLSETTPA